MNIWVAQFGLEIFFLIKNGHKHGWIGKGVRVGEKWRQYEMLKEQQSRSCSNHPSETRVDQSGGSIGDAK